MNKLICFVFICCFSACDDDKKNPETEEVPVTIVGKWVSTSLLYTIDDGNGTITHGAVDAPFTGQIDLIEYLRFTPDSMYYKICNEQGEGDPFRYFYTPNKKMILITDGVETDTLFHVNGLSATALYFSYTDRDTSNGKISTVEYNYSAKKQ